jgi:hypothetical protein
LTICIFFTTWDCVVLLEHIFDHVDDTMGTDARSPAKVADSIIDASAAGVAL